MQLDNLLARLGLDTAQRDALQLALTHKSYINENGGAHADSNERLEYLGDAALGLATAAHIYHAFPQMDEGEMTILRSLLVRRETLSRWAKTLDLGERLLISKGETRGGGRERPIILASAFEAIVGMIFEARGLDGVAAFLEPFVSQEIATVMADGLHLDYKSRLQTVVQRATGGLPTYRVVDTSGLAHQRQYVVAVEVGGQELARGDGTNKQDAQRNAARSAYLAIESGQISITKEEPS